MILTIDKNRIDFTLENEIYLDEVIDNVNKWLSENQLIIEKLYINNEDFSKHDLKIELKDVNIIEIETLSFRDLNVNNLSWITYFFERLIKAIKIWDTKILDQVKMEIPFVLNHLPTVLSLDNKTPENIYVENINKYLNKYNNFQCKEEFINKEEVIDLLNSIVLLLNERLNEYTNTMEELKSSITVLVSMQQELEAVSIYLQSGKENKAAIIMNKFTSIFHKILRVINFNLKNTEIVDDKNLKKFTEGLDDILTELLDGYESQDTVLIGDILEYELSPRIDLLKQIFS